MSSRHISLENKTKVSPFIILLSLSFLIYLRIAVRSSLFLWVVYKIIQCGEFSEFSFTVNDSIILNFEGMHTYIDAYNIQYEK
jgi:hypothetical protein